MDSQQFDAIVGALGSTTTRRGALGLLVGLAGLGVSEVAARRHHQGGKPHGKSKGKAKGAAQGAKVKICHRTGSESHPFQVITVATSAVPAHKAHGDLVSCPNLQVIDFETCTCVCPVAQIACGAGEQLDLEACACVSQPVVCEPEECTSQSDMCATCRCRVFDTGSFCVCRHATCQNGPCNPQTGCPS